MVKSPKVDSSDLNGIDFLNGEANVNYEGIAPIGLKGAFEKQTGLVSNVYGNIDEITEYYSTWNELLTRKFVFLHIEYRKLIQQLSENWEYENLPNGLNKYRIEMKAIPNGSTCLTKIGDKFWSLNYTTDSFNVYGEADKITINEVGFDIDKYQPDKFVILRSNYDKIGFMQLTFRQLNMLEKILFAIEKNITTSAPKGLILNNGLEISTPDNQPKADLYESVVNGDNSFYEVNIDEEMIDFLNKGVEKLFIPMELRDRTEELIRNYMFIKEELKENIGAGINLLANKKSRLITSEVDEQQDISDNILVHMLNQRKLAIEEFNLMYGLNVIVKLAPHKKDALMPKEEVVNNEGS